MENLDLVGEFWKAGDPDHRITGRFMFDSIAGGELTLDGCFWEYPEPGMRTRTIGSGISKEPIRILGNAGGQLLTLHGCYCAGISGNMGHGLPTHLSERYIVQIALSGGVYFDDEQEMQFDKVQLQFRQMEHWVGMSGIHVEEDRTHTGIAEQVRIIINPLESLQAQSGVGGLQLSFSYNLDSNPYQPSIKQTCVLTVTFESATSLDMILSMCSKLQDLLTISLDSVASVTELALHRNDIPPVQCYMLFQDSDVQPSRSTSTPKNLLFGFIEIGQLEGVAKWLNMADDFAPAIGALMSRWYMPSSYVEPHFFNAVTAAETLEKLRENKQAINRKRITLKQRLLSLANSAGDAFAALVGNVDNWATAVVRTRNQHVVHRGLGDVDTLRIYHLSESLYFLVVLCLMRECGMPGDVLDSVQTNQRFIRIKRQLQS